MSPSIFTLSSALSSNRSVQWTERADVIFEANVRVGITFEWRHRMLCVAKFTPLSPARDSGKIALGMMLTAINGISILALSQHEVRTGNSNIVKS